jgi:hypothetical protein
MSFETLSISRKNVFKRTDLHGLTLGFNQDSAASTDLAFGQAVKLKTSAAGEVTGVTAVTEEPFGFVWKQPSADEAQKNVVVVPVTSCAELHGQADGTVAIGDNLAVSGYDATTGFPKFKKAVATNYICAIAITGGATTTEINVLLMPPVLMA